MKSKESLISEREVKGQKLKINVKNGAIIQCPPTSGEVLLEKEAQAEAGQASLTQWWS